MHKFAIVQKVSVILLIFLSGCGGNNPSVVVNELSSNIVSYDEIIRINNCGGKADSEQTASRSFATTFEGGAEISAGYQGVVEGGISAKYSQYRNITKSQRLIAPPGTNMEFVLRWSEEIHAGNVIVNGSSGDYEVRVPVSVEQISSQDLNHCDGESQIVPTSAPSSAEIQPTKASINTESRPDTLIRYDEIYSQNDWCTLWNTLIDDNLVRGSCPVTVTQLPKVGDIVGANGNVIYGAQIRISSDIQIIYPACATFSKSSATAEGGKVLAWVNNDFIGTNMAMKENSFFTLFFRCEDTIAP
jgi:hypothetical protein